MDIKFKYKRFAITINQADTTYAKKFDLDKNIRLIRGLQISADNPELLFYRGSQKIEINGKEIFPDDYESRFLLSGIGVAPDNRFVDFGEGIEPGNGEVKVWYRDTQNYIDFVPYQVILILKCDL